MANDPEKAVTLRSVSAGGRFLRETRGTIGLSSRLTLLGDDDDGSPADICSWAAATQAGTQLYSPSQNVWRRCAQILHAGKFYE